MWVHVARASAGATLWLLALALMIARTAGEPSYFTGWSVLLALGASVFTCWHLLVLERIRIETIARLAAELALEDRARQASKLEAVK